MKLEWLQKNINDTSNMPEFEWYSTENWILRNYYLQMTILSQGKCSFQMSKEMPWRILKVQYKLFLFAQLKYNLRKKQI